MKKLLKGVLNEFYPLAEAYVLLNLNLSLVLGTAGNGDGFMP